MRLSEFAGYGDKMEQLMRSVQAGRIVHALLLVGPHGSGKRTMARLLAQATVCTGRDRPCGVCPACKRFLNGTHPDIHVIVPEKTEAFIVPKGTLVKLNTGVWHLAALPVHNDVLHVMIILPERVYANDCTVCDYPEDRQVEILL